MHIEASGIRIIRDQDHRIIRTCINRFPKALDFLIGYPVRRQFICMKHPARAVSPCMIGKFCSEAAIWLNFSTDQTVEAFESHCDDATIVLYSTTENTTLRVCKDFSYIL